MEIPVREKICDKSYSGKCLLNEVAKNISLYKRKESRNLCLTVQKFAIFILC